MGRFRLFLDKKAPWFVKIECFWTIKTNFLLALENCSIFGCFWSRINKFLYFLTRKQHSLLRLRVFEQHNTNFIEVFGHETTCFACFFYSFHSIFNFHMCFIQEFRFQSLLTTDISAKNGYIIYCSYLQFLSLFSTIFLFLLLLGFQNITSCSIASFQGISSIFTSNTALDFAQK